VVWEALVVRVLTNPLILRGTLLLLLASGAFFLGMFVIRRLRANLLEEVEAEVDLDAAGPGSRAMPVQLYSGIIQQLKQQKHELQLQTLAEQRRLRTTENFSQAVLSNLPSGVLVFGTNGLVKQANPAAKDILGFRSLPGMSAQDIFRGAEVCSRDASQVFSDGLKNSTSSVWEEINSVLHQGGGRRQMETNYATPAGQKLHLAVTLSPIPCVDGSLLGMACLISDRSEFERVRRQQQMQGEVSAEMALQLRTSLTSIAGYAQQLAHNREPGLASQLAADIANEAASLDRRIGGFLVQKPGDSVCTEAKS
jgi:PAS domain-containing protein